MGVEFKRVVRLFCRGRVCAGGNGGGGWSGGGGRVGDGGAALGTICAGGVGAEVVATFSTMSLGVPMSISADCPSDGSRAQNGQDQPARHYCHADKRCRFVKGIVGIVPEVKLETCGIQQSVFRGARYVTALGSPALRWVVDAGTPLLADSLLAFLRAAGWNPTIMDNKHAKASAAKIKRDGIFHITRRRNAEALGVEVEHSAEREYENGQEGHKKGSAKACCKSQFFVPPYKSTQRQQRNKNQTDPNPRKLNASVRCQNHKLNLSL